MNIYVGNLSSAVVEADLEEAFGKFGKVQNVKLIKDMFTQESKGFAFVEMANNTEAQTAIDGLNTEELKDKRIIVNEARPQRDRKGKSKGRRY